MNNGKLKLIICNLAVMLCLLMIIELVLFISVRTNVAGIYPLKLKNIIKGLRKNERNSIQYDLGCSGYDSELAYLLKENADFTFKSFEFSTHYRTNSKGLRDDENSLSRPEIIVIGDSYALGWGVEQEETFAQVLEKELKTKVLNCSMSSYGTVRELKLLNRMDRTNLKWLIVQYAPNDFQENITYIRKNFTLNPMSKELYAGLADWSKRAGTYYPFKYLKLLAEKALEAVKRPSDKESPASEYHEAKAFIEILLKAPIDFSKTSLIVFELADYKAGRSFAKNLYSAIKEDPRCAGLDIHILDFAGLLKESEYIFLDDHINREGHKKIAEILKQTILNGTAAQNAQKRAIPAR